MPLSRVAAVAHDRSWPEAQSAAPGPRKLFGGKLPNLVEPASVSAVGGKTFRPRQCGMTAEIDPKCHSGPANNEPYSLVRDLRGWCDGLELPNWQILRTLGSRRFYV